MQPQCTQYKHRHTLEILKKKVNATCTVLERPWGLQKFQAPRFQNNKHTKVVSLSALSTGRLYPLQEIFLVLISVPEMYRSKNKKQQWYDNKRGLYSIISIIHNCCYHQ